MKPILRDQSVFKDGEHLYMQQLNLEMIKNWKRCSLTWMIDIQILKFKRSIKTNSVIDFRFNGKSLLSKKDSKTLEYFITISLLQNLPNLKFNFLTRHFNNSCSKFNANCMRAIGHNYANSLIKNNEFSDSITTKLE